MQDDTLLKIGFLLYVEKTLPDFTFRDINRKYMLRLVLPMKGGGIWTHMKKENLYS